MTPRKMIQGAFCLVLIASALSASAIDQDFCFWNSINVKKQLTDDFSLHLRNENWIRDNVSELEQWYVRFWGTYKVTPWLSVGPGWEYMETRNAAGSSCDFFRRRNDFFAQAALNWSLGDFMFNLRGRYTYVRYMRDARKVGGSGKPKPPADLNNDFFRTRLTVKYRIDKECPLTPYVAGEIFNWRHVTQSRAFVGGIYKFNANHSIDLYYCRQTYYLSRLGNDIIALEYTFSF